jgi:RNA polymerase sigma factor (sigma-70 family)
MKFFKSDDKNPGWSLLYDKYKPVFMQFARKYFAVDRDTAEDIYQESFIVLYENIRENKFRESSVSIQTYLFAIGKNKLLNHLRDNDRDCTAISENTVLPDIAGEPDTYLHR